MHHRSGHEALAMLQSDGRRGLGGAEAERRLRRHGPNVLPRTERSGVLRRLAVQFHHPLIYVLLVSAAATYAVGEPVDGSVILAVVVANAVIGFVQESRAEHSLDALAAMVTVRALVVRDGRPQRTEARQLVPGDVVLLAPGDKVGADLRLLEIDGLEVDESALTGESVPVVKSEAVLLPETLLADRANMAFSGTLVTAGRGRGLVVATGADTELGLIHRLLGGTADLATPLTRKLARFSGQLTVVILALAVASFAIGLARDESAADMLVAAVALAVGAIPEGLPAAVTIALAIGVSRMAGRNAIVRRLPAVETLGSTTVICTDKTGTLTQNAMAVQTVVAGGRRYELDGAGYAPEGTVSADGSPVRLCDHPALATCLTAGLLCGDGDLRLRDGAWEPVGDPTEAALVVAAGKVGLVRAQLLAEHPRTAVLPFDSERRYMATAHRGAAGPVLFAKGAVEQVLAMCDRGLDAAGGHRPLDAAAVHAAADELGARGQRVLALATRTLGPHEQQELEHLQGLTFLGLQAMSDPPRPEAVRAVRACREAGIAVKMITGDHAATAAAIAVRVGLVDDGPPRVAGGDELERCPDAELAALVAETQVFARVSAEQKLRLVRALQGAGEVVAMTGDGVNDAPALSQADVGVAMGRGGTEVAREAADIVLADDDFASIEAAVEEGRHTFDNLRKFIVWTLPTNGGEGLLILAAILVGTRLPILPVQVLWINMTTAVLLGLTLAFERTEPGIMLRAPRRPSEPLVTRELVVRMLLVAVLLLIAAFWLFERELDRGRSVDEARTVAVNVFVAVEVLYLFSCRSLTGRARDLGLLSNRWLLAGVGLTVALQLAFTYWGPMNSIFSSAPLDATMWLQIVAAATIAWVVIELVKRRQSPRGSAGGSAGPARGEPDRDGDQEDRDDRDDEGVPAAAEVERPEDDPQHQRDGGGDDETHGADPMPRG